jgi:hypothetical protein
MKRPRPTPAAILLAALALGGCAPIAQIHYSQLGACTHAQRPDGLHIDAPPSHAIVLFRINQIDNSKPAVGWSFDPGKLQVNPPSDPQTNLGGTGPVAIAAHGIVPVNRPVGIMIETASADGKDAAGIREMLLYPNEPPAPGTISVNDTPTPPYPFNPDCNALLGP